jgi:NAD(P)-dependent dehydrogenase (short-subunit alcohol dehydrogenase family)
MAKVPLPERGQPLDVTYIYQLADTINDLATQVSNATYNYTTIDTTTAGKQSIKTSDARVFGGIDVVANNSAVNAGNEKTFSISFDGDFKFPPIVSATPVNLSGTPAGQNLTVVVTSVTTGGVRGVVRFNASGDVSVSVHVLAIGIPN